MRIWRAYGIAQGRLIPYQDLFVRSQDPTGLVVTEKSFPLKEARLHNTVKNGGGGRANGLFAYSDLGGNMVFKKLGTLESYLNVDEHGQILRNSVAMYEKLKETLRRNCSMLTTRKSTAH